MPKRVTELNEAIARRSRRESASRQPIQDRPRLAERLVELAPLARAPVVIDEADQTSDDKADLELSRLPDDDRFKPRAASRPPPPPLPSNALILSDRGGTLIQAETPVTLTRYEEEPPPLPSLHRAGSAIAAKRRAVGFITGLSIATAVGIALYAILV